MKKLKTILSIISCMAIICSLSTISASAELKILGYYPDGTPIGGSEYAELVGFDENGEPIIEYNFPEDIQKSIEESGSYDGNADVPMTIGDSDQTIGDSKVTALRGDVNLDGDVNGLDLLYLKKYLLGLIEW